MDGKDYYLLSRGTFSSIRLTAQHFLWRDHLGWNLHPAGLAAIEQKTSRSELDGDQSDDDKSKSTQKPLAIADIGCGNGLWLQQEARSPSYPANTTFHGFDISDAQFPPPTSLPSNVAFSILNASDPSRIPQEHHNAFDIVHARLLIGSIVNDPIHFLRSFLTLLRPGGFLQWDEIDPHNSQPFPPTTDPCKWSGFIPRLIKSKRPGIDMPMTWLNQLASLFEGEGMTDVQHLRGGPAKPEMRRYWTDNDFGVLTEVVSGLGAPKEVFEEVEEGFKKREQEIMYEIRITTGRKAL